MTAAVAETDPLEPAFEHMGEDVIHQGRVLRLVAARYRGPAGEEFVRDVVRSLGAVAVVAIDDGPEGPCAVLVRQYRPALDRWLLEIPAGMRDKPGEPPAQTAARELQEEAGFAAASLEFLTTFANAAGMTDHETQIFLARGLTHVGTATDGVEEEYLRVERLPLTDVPRAIAAGELGDAKSMIGLLLVRDRLGLR